MIEHLKAAARLFRDEILKDEEMPVLQKALASVLIPMFINDLIKETEQKKEDIRKNPAFNKDITEEDAETYDEKLLWEEENKDQKKVEPTEKTRKRNRNGSFVR